MRRNTLVLAGLAAAVLAGSAAMAFFSLQSDGPLDTGGAPAAKGKLPGPAPEDLSYLPEQGPAGRKQDRPRREKPEAWADRPGKNRPGAANPEPFGSAPAAGTSAGNAPPEDDRGQGGTPAGPGAGASDPDPGETAEGLFASGGLPVVTELDKPGGFVVKATSAASGEALQGASVRVSGPGLDLSSATGPKGMVGVGLQKPFRVELAVSAAGHRPFSALLESTSMPRDGIVRAVLEPFVYLSPKWVSLSDAETGAPLSGVLLKLSDAKSSAFLKTGGDGRALLPLETLSFPVHLAATLPGYMDARFVAPGGQGKDLFEFRMFRQRELEALFLSAPGSPVPGVKASLLPSGDGWSGKTLEAVSGPDGVARFSGLPAGSGTVFTLNADVEGFARVRKTFSAEESLKSSSRFTVTLAPSLWFEGRLTGHEGWLDKGLVVEYLFPPESEFEYKPDQSQVLARAVAPEASGSFRIEGARQGPVRLRVRAGAEALHLCDLSARSGLRFEIALTGTRPVSVAVVDEAGSPRAGARIVVARRDEGFERLRLEGLTDGAGLFRFTGCAPGAYSGAVVAEGYLETGFDLRVGAGPEAACTVVVRKAAAPGK